MSKSFVHLHNHTDASVLDGHAKPEEYLERVQALHQIGFGVTDHGSLGNVYKVISLCKKLGLTPIPGLEAYMAPTDQFRPPETEEEYDIYGSGGQVPVPYPMYPVRYDPHGAKRDDVSGGGAYTHLTIFAITKEGVENLFAIHAKSTMPSRKYRKPRIDLELLSEHSEGLICATGCPSSEVVTRLALGQEVRAYQHASDLQDIFGKGNVFVEVMDHHMNHDVERRTLNDLRMLSKKLNIPLLATNDCHYVNQSDHVPHEIMLANQTGAKMSQKSVNDGGSRFCFDGDEYYIKTAEEMYSIFPEDTYPGACSNTLLVAEMAQDVDFPSVENKRPMPKGVTDPITELRKRIEIGKQWRFGDDPNVDWDVVNRRVESALETIESSNFSTYMLTVADFVDYARQHYAVRDANGNILTDATGAGRGSAGGSIIAFLLGITNINPIEHDLLEGRFLTPGRGERLKITYEDGSVEEEVNAGERYIRNGETVYAHSLNVGDTVEKLESNVATDD